MHGQPVIKINRQMFNFFPKRLNKTKTLHAIKHKVECLLNNYGNENAKNYLFVYSSRYIVIKQLFAGDVNLRPSFMISIARSISAIITSRSPCPSVGYTA